MAQYLESLRRTAELLDGSAVLHPSHGPVASEGRAVLERYVEHRQRREDSLVAALAEGISTEPELVARVYAGVDERLFPIAARSLRAGLEKLRDEGRAVETENGTWVPESREPGA